MDEGSFYGIFFDFVMEGVGDEEFDVDDDPLGSLGTPLVGPGRESMESNLTHGYQASFFTLPRFTRSVRTKTFFWGLELSSKYIILLLKKTFEISILLSCLNILDEFERHLNHSRFTEIYVPVESMHIQSWTAMYFFFSSDSF